MKRSKFRYRLLVAGSRNWGSREVVYEALNRVYLKMTRQAAKRGLVENYELVVVHGACRTGADRFVKEWVYERRFMGWCVREEPHPYKRELGKRGGPVRNEEMVALGADEFLGFPLDGNGTWGCIRLAHAAGIPITIEPIPK